MMPHRLSRFIAAASAVAAAVLFALPQAGAQQPWPSRPVTLVVPFSAGTTSDVIARGLAQHLSEVIGQPFVIDNRSGAGGNVGAGSVATSQPDGYTLLFATTGPAATNQLTYKSMSYNPQTDFVPVILAGKSPIIVVARPDAPFSTLKELVAYAKANPDKLTAGFPGNGSLGHITGKLLKTTSGIDFAEAQYRGSPAIMNDIIGNHIDIGMDSMAPYVPNVQAGKIKALAIASSSRWSKLPNVPTAAESGLPGFDASVWYAILAPKGTAPEIVAKLNAVTNAYLKSDKTKAALNDIGVQILGGTPDDLKAWTAAEVKKWGPVIKAANISF